jgi:hypothetical protein
MAKATALPIIPAVRLRVDPALRTKLSDAADRIISILDRLDPDPDLEPAGDETINLTAKACTVLAAVLLKTTSPAATRTSPA